MSNESISNNKRIAKNTILLYARMIVLLVISLYTSRVILKVLGVDDYGIYNVVGGLVSMFTVLSGSLSAAISRFITFELGKGDVKRQETVFTTSVNIQLLLIVALFLIFETIGLWFLNYKMVIPNGRLEAANWVFQFSIITFAFSLLAVPYNALIISHERMAAFAYISLFEALAKLGVAFLIFISPIDRLVFYGLLLLFVSVFVRFLYVWYCKRNFVECKYRVSIDKPLTREMLSFAGWNFFGAGSWQLMTQGVNLLLNVYFGVVVNAARGIANQIDAAVLQFVYSFTTAINPQITKSYASDDKNYMFFLIFKGAKLSYFLMLFFAVPIFCETDFILHIWLGDVPDYTVEFVRLALLVSMIHVLSNTMITAMLATGDIKKYQIIVGGLGMLIFPLAWIFFKLGLPPESAYIATIIIFVCQLFIRLKLLNDMIGLSPSQFIREVLVKTMTVTVIAASLPTMLTYMMHDDCRRFFIVGSISVVCSILSIWFVGLSKQEREMASVYLSNLRSKVIK